VGIAVTADATELLVGAYDEDSATHDIDGDQNDNTAPNAGAAYLFRRSGAVWTQAHYVKGSNSDTGDGFGHRVAISADGITTVISAPDEASASQGIAGNPGDNSAMRAGAVYIFR
jgi:hypothetical protein